MKKITQKKTFLILALGKNFGTKFQSLNLFEIVFLISNFIQSIFSSLLFKAFFKLKKKCYTAKKTFH